MTRIPALVGIAITLVAPAGTSLAEDLTEFDRRRSGTRGYVTAYEADGFTVIDVDACPYGYSACGQGFRESINNRLCSRHGSGRHTWYYQIGDSRKIRNTASCRCVAAGGSEGDVGPEPGDRGDTRDDVDEYDRRRAGTRNHVTAYDSDGRTIIDVDACPNGYSACGASFRDSIKRRLCRKYGLGRHTWYYQVGDSTTPIANTAICK
jgi:hypothetical protein